MAKNTFATRALGDYRVTTVSDGFALAPAATLVRSTDRLDFANQLRMSRQLHKPFMRADVLMFVVDTGATRILIDAGAGRALGPSMGAAPKNLRSAGLAATDITKVLISHPHPDHLCGISDRDGMLIRTRTSISTAPTTSTGRAGSHLSAIRQSARALHRRGSASSVRSGDELDAGIAAIPLPGHTIGHTGFEIRSAGESALFWATSSTTTTSSWRTRTTRSCCATSTRPALQAR